jgi:ribosomal protein S21
MDVHRGNVDQALRMMFKRMKEEGLEKRQQECLVHVTPAEQRKLDKKESARRFMKRDYKRMMTWVMRRKNRCALVFLSDDAIPRPSELVQGPATYKSPLHLAVLASARLPCAVPPLCVASKISTE